LINPLVGGSFDELAFLETSPDADERDRVRRVYRAPAFYI
jgi:hypothetical protein